MVSFLTKKGETSISYLIESRSGVGKRKEGDGQLIIKRKKKEKNSSLAKLETLSRRGSEHGREEGGKGNGMRESGVGEARVEGGREK